MGPERVRGRQRLGPEHVQHRMTQPARIQRRQQVVLDHQRPAAGVDQHRPARQQRQRARVQQPARPGRVGQQRDQDLGPPQRRVQPVARQHRDPLDRRTRGRPARHPETQPGQCAGDGRAELSGPQHHDRAFRGQWRHDLVPPHPVLRIAVHSQMRPQRPAGAVFHHTLRQPRIDHPAQRLGQRGVADDPLDPCPQALHDAGTGEGREIHRAAILGIAGGIDHRVKARRVALALQVKLGAGGAQGRRPVVPQRGGGGEEGPHLSAACSHGRTGRCRRPSAGSSAACRHSSPSAAARRPPASAPSPSPC